MMRVFLPAALVISVALLPVVVTAQEGAEAALARAESLVAAGDYEAALETLRGALDARPGDVRLLVALGRTAYAQGLAAIAEMNASLGRLALLDGARWLAKAVEADPKNAEALRLLGACALEGQDFATAADAFRRAADLDPADGESRYQQAFAMAYDRRFAEAVPVFEEAYRILGPQPRILLNRGVCHASLGETAAAVEWFSRLVDVEAEAGRTSSEEIRSAWLWLWKVHASAQDFAGAEAVFAGLAKRHADLAAGWWYLGHARTEQGRHAEAAEAFARLTQVSPDYADGHRRHGEALLLAGRPGEAEAALGRLVALDPEGEGARDLLLAIAGTLPSGDAAEALFARHEAAFEKDAVVLEARADGLLRAGRAADAVRFYRKAAARDPFGDALKVKEQKAASAVLRTGVVPEDLKPLRPAPKGFISDFDAPEVICDFETSQVFVRVEGAATADLSGGVFRVERRGEPAGVAGLSLTFIPGIDVREFTALRFRVRGSEGRPLRVRVKDRFDQFEYTDAFVRLWFPEPVILDGDWRTVTLPLSAIVPSNPMRRIPFSPVGLRGLLFDLGAVPDAPAAPGLTMAPLAEAEIDDVALVRADESALVVADFEEPPRETLFVTEGAAAAFAPTLFAPEQVADFRPDPNSIVNPATMGGEFDPATVHGGTGAFRLTVAREGAGWGALTFNPDRSFAMAHAITFWARGVDGGERVRVVFKDSHDLAMGAAAFAAAPRYEAADTLAEGWFTLTAEWKQYRIPRAALPDVDFDCLARVEFHFGTDQGNPLGTTLYLDDLSCD